MKETDKMDRNWPKIHRMLMKHEGGFVNDPADLGGATKFGVTLRTLREYRKKDVTLQDVRDLTYGEARNIARDLYWKPLRCDVLPDGVDYSVFDCGYLHGVRNGRVWLREAAGLEGDGPLSDEIVALISAADPVKICQSLRDAREARMRSRPNASRFLRGWLRRSKEVYNNSLSLIPKTVKTSLFILLIRRLFSWLRN